LKYFSDSHYPRGHYIRVIGNEGERKTEDEVILLEHEVPYDEFSPAVLACLPEIPWSPHPLDPPEREDLTSLDICSVDPEGFFEFIFANFYFIFKVVLISTMLFIAVNWDLIVLRLESTLLMVFSFKFFWIKIPSKISVTHFVRPGTAIDQTAAERSTTVYLCGRRIDMLPSLLSTNLYIIF